MLKLVRDKCCLQDVFAPALLHEVIFARVARA
jgi:hypothetical protein